MKSSQFDALERQLERRALFHGPTSTWTIGQQIEHCCKVIEGVHAALRQSQPPAPRARVSVVRRGVFLTGRIPRGRAKAPKNVHPQTAPERAHLESCLRSAREHVEAIRGLDARAWFRHFVFDVLTRDEALRFLEIHTDHHLRIMADIARRA